MEATGQLVEAKAKGDRAGMAKAEASLAQIRTEEAALPKP
jgi:hypothetical protein